MTAKPILPVAELVAAASAIVPGRSARIFAETYPSEHQLFVDIRDIREIEREGFIPQSEHCPRGMLEFWADPSSPYHKTYFDTDRELVLYCASGWRSALSARTLLDMGFANVSHINDGFSAWKTCGGPIIKK